MAVNVERDRAVNLPFSATQAMRRLIDELAIHGRSLNRSQVIRVALIEKADRDLPADWRQTVGFVQDGEAA